MTTRSIGRRSMVLVALVAAIAGSLAPVATPHASAAAPDLTLTADSRYEVDPDKGRIHVTVSLTATNHLKDTKTRLYFFDQAYLAVLPGTTGFKITSDTGVPTVKVTSKKADHTMLRIDFNKRLAAGASRTFTLTFDIPDPGGAPTRDLRIGTSLVSFGAWAFASDSTPGGSVTVVFPPDYAVEVQTGEMRKPSKDAAGRTIITSGRLTQPLAFFAYFVADRPNAYTETTRPVEVDGRPLDLAVRAWPDDPAWGERVGALLERGVPALSERIGLPWRADRPLVVAEAINRSTAGYSGRYDPATGRIEIAYYADSFVVLHEAAHAWFNGSLMADRWANEGFASWYAQDTATAIGEKVTVTPLTPELAGRKVPLNAWGAVGSNDAATEDYGYAGSAELARLVAERAGPSALASVWDAARRGIGAYQPVALDAPGAAEQEAGSGPPDWRGLLDLLEERTGKSYDDLWRTWVVRPGDAAQLGPRATARRQYAEVVARAGDWQLPAVVRQAMRAWQFGQATDLLDAANLALDDRDAIVAAADGAGLAVPRAFEAAFESDAGFPAAATEADAELLTIEAYVRARDARPANPGIVEAVGLWWATPEADFARAADTFEAGDLRGSVAASAAARLAWERAADVGRSRLMTILAAMLVAVVMVGFLVSWFRALRTRRLMRRRRTMARPIARPRS